MKNALNDQFFKRSPSHITIPPLPCKLGDAGSKSYPDNLLRYRMEVRDLDMHADQVIQLRMYLS